MRKLVGYVIKRGGRYLQETDDHADRTWRPDKGRARIFVDAAQAGAARASLESTSISRHATRLVRRYRRFVEPPPKGPPETAPPPAMRGEKFAAMLDEVGTLESTVLASAEPYTPKAPS